MKKSSIFIGSLLLCSLFWPLHGFASPATTTEARTAKWAELRQTNSELVRELAELELQISLLKTPTAELVKQLAEAKLQLNKSQVALATSNAKLEDAGNSLNDAKSSLESLSKCLQMEREKNKAVQDRIRRQRNTAYILLGFAIVKLAVDAI